MCGFAGFWTINGIGSNTATILNAMGDAIFSRGPDDSGMWIDRDNEVAFVHRRLAILDLSPAGHQPMVSRSAKYVIVFNGEIYNHLALRSEIEAESSEAVFEWRGHSDTETLLACIERWGLALTLKKAIGMFSVAVWNQETKVLSLARDRLGEKPIYFGVQGKTFLFGSQLKSIKKHPDFLGVLDRKSISLQMKYNYIPCPNSIYHGVSKLHPGHGVDIKISNDSFQFENWTYWDFEDCVKQTDIPLDCSFSEAEKMLDRLVTDSVELQLQADVPVGCFLSGGIDSSLVSAIAQKVSKTQLKTFTIGFDDRGFNEAVYAKSVARHINSDHTELYVSPEQALSVIPSLPEIYDEPFSDSSQIPTFLVSKLASSNVKVCLSGDGGDELFGGYRRYTTTNQMWNFLTKMPLRTRSFISAGVQAIPINYIDALGAAMPFAKLPANFGDKTHKAAAVVDSCDVNELYDRLITHWHPSDELLIFEEETASDKGERWNNLRSDVLKMMARDTVTYLPDDILCKVDRASMAVSLETRVPLLDFRIVEFAWSLPQDMKIQNGKGKILLRNLLSNYIPKEMIERPKMGFGVPLGAWLRGPLREWAESLINEDRLVREGIFRPAAVRKKWDEHISGVRNWQYLLWDVLMFQAWYENE